MAGRKLEVQIVGDASSLKRALDVAESGAKRTGGHFGRLAKLAGLAAGGAGIGALIGTLKVGADEFSQHAKVAAQTGAVLKSTGGEANISAKEIENLASSIMRKSGIDDEAVQSGENMLLTFTNIRNEVGKGNDIFNQSASILADMSTALGTDMNKSAIQLGKALNDPIKGITALTRVGVSFTQAQKDQIKAMVDSGNTMGAQKLILGELNKEFGGSAEAAGKTLPGQLKLLREEFNNVAGDIVAKMIPALTKVVSWVSDHWPEISAVMKAVFGAIGFAITKGVIPAIEAMVDVGKVVVSYVKQHWPEISAMAKRVFGDVKEAVQDVVKVVSFIWEHFGDQIVSQTKIAWEFIKKYLGGVFQTIQGMVEIITGLLHGNFGKMWEGIKDMFSGQTKVIQAVFEAGLKTLVNLAATLGEAARQALLKPIATLAGAVAGHIADVGRAITDKFSAAAGWGEGLATHIKDGVTGGLKGIGAGAWDVVNNVGEFISGKAGTIRDWGEGIGTKIKNAVPAAIVGIGNEAWDKINNVGEFIAGKAGAVKEWGANIGNWIKNAAPAALVGIGNAAWDKINNIGSAITDKAEAVKGWGDHLANLIEAGLRGGLHIGAAIADGVDRAWGAVKEAFGDLKDKIVHWLRSAFDWFSPSGLFEELGQDMMHGLAKGIVGKAAHPLEALKWMFKIVGKAFPGNWQDWLQNVAGAGVGLVRSAVGTNAPSEIIGGATGNALAMAEWMDSVLNHYPYTWGGGHAQIGQPSRSTGLSPHGHWYPGVGFDCSGFVSGALHAGGMLNSVLVSGDFGSWGANGPDPRGVSVAYNPDHTYLNLRGRNYGTGWGVNGGPGTDGTGFDMSGRYGWSHWPGGLRGTSSYAGPDTLEPLSNPGDFAARETFLGLGSAAAGIMPTAGPNNLVGALGGGNVGGFWKGTAFAPGGWAMVGEKGPELMYVPRGSQIIPNGRVPGGSTANSPGGGDMTIHVPISLDGQLVADVVQKQLLRKQARNGTTGLV